MLSMRLLRYLVIFGLGVPGGRPAQDEGPELLLPGHGYHHTDLPGDAPGTWWVLHRPAGTTGLEELPVVVTSVRGCADELPHERSGRDVTVPRASGPILLVRGLPGLAAGPVRTAFLDRAGEGEAAEVQARWGELSLQLRHVTDPPIDDQPGRYRVELTAGDRSVRLHSDAWHGDGHWRVRWIGDLNRDGWPDLLLDASYKYSVYTTRLYLSRERDGRLELTEVATFEHTAC